MLNSIIENFGFPDEFFDVHKDAESVCSGGDNLDCFMESEVSSTDTGYCSADVNTSNASVTLASSSDAVMACSPLGEGNAHGGSHQIFERREFGDKHREFSDHTVHTSCLEDLDCFEDAEVVSQFFEEKPTATNDHIYATRTTTSDAHPSVYSGLYEFIRDALGTADPTQKLLAEETAPPESVSATLPPNKQKNIAAAHPKNKRKAAAQSSSADPKKKRKAAARLSAANPKMKAWEPIGFPKGWESFTVLRNKGASAGKKYDKYFVEPVRTDGAKREKFKSRPDAEYYLITGKRRPVKTYPRRKASTAKKGSLMTSAETFALQNRKTENGSTSSNPDPVNIVLPPAPPRPLTTDEDALTSEIENEVAQLLASGLFKYRYISGDGR